MTVQHKLSLGLCIICIGLSLGCSRDSRNSDAGAVAPETHQSSGAELDVDTDNSATIADQLSDRNQLATRIEEGAHVDIAAIDTELARIRRDLIIDRYFEKLYSNSVSEQAIESYYRDHADEFVTREIELAHILLKIPAGASAEVRSAVNTQARDIAARIHTGENFAALAQEYSDDDVSSSLAGSLGWVGEHELDESVMLPALELEPGSVSEPLMTAYGIHLVKVLNGVREIQKPLTEVRARIVQSLRLQARDAALNQLASAEL